MDISFETVDNFKKTFTKPIYSKDLSEHGQITSIELSQYDWSQDAVLIGFANKVLLGYLKFRENVELEIISEFPFPSRCNCLSLSPETNLSAISCTVLFAAATTDFKIRVIKTDLVNENFCEILSGHSSYVNDMKFSPDNKYLASVSDDNSLKIWEVGSFKCYANVQLDFPGVSVQWHKNEPLKLLISDKKGLIQLCNIENLKPVLSLDTGKMLSSCHWSPSNSQLIASLQLGELSLWDLTVPSIPKFSNLIFTEAGGFVKFSPQGESIAALNTLEGTLKVFRMNLQEQIFSTFVNSPTNLCWHFRYPIICVGDDSKFYIWKVNTM